MANAKDGWEIAVDIAQVLSALGTLAAVITSLWLSHAARRVRARIELDTHTSPIYTTAKPSEGRLTITNLSDRNAVVLDARWRLGRHGPSATVLRDFYGDDQEKVPLEWSEIKPILPRTYVVPYRYNTMQIARIFQGPFSAAALSRIRLEIEFSSGRVIRIKLPTDFAREMAACQTNGPT